MAKVPEIIPITDLRQDSSAVLKRIRSSRQPVIITQRGRVTVRFTTGSSIGVEEVADATVFLTSNRAMNGRGLRVEGGIVRAL